MKSKLTRAILRQSQTKKNEEAKRFPGDAAISSQISNLVNICLAAYLDCDYLCCSMTFACKRLWPAP